MKLHELKPPAGSRKRRKIVGRPRGEGKRGRKPVQAGGVIRGLRAVSCPCTAAFPSADS